MMSLFKFCLGFIDYQCFEKRINISLLWPTFLTSPEFRQRFEQALNSGNVQTSKYEG